MTAALPASVGRRAGDWRVDAECREADPALFFPQPGDPGVEAKSLCGRCVVREECLADAMRFNANRDRWGIRGGMSAEERQKARRLS